MTDTERIERLEGVIWAALDDIAGMVGDLPEGDLRFALQELASDLSHEVTAREPANGVQPSEAAGLPESGVQDHSGEPD